MHACLPACPSVLPVCLSVGRSRCAVSVSLLSHRARGERSPLPPIPSSDRRGAPPNSFSPAMNSSHKTGTSDDRAKAVVVFRCKSVQGDAADDGGDDGEDDATTATRSSNTDSRSASFTCVGEREITAVGEIPNDSYGNGKRPTNLYPREASYHKLRIREPY